MKKKIPRKLTISVVGMQHRMLPETRRIVAARVKEIGPVEVELIREPENPHDPNAIKVIIDAGPYKNMHIGYVPRRVAEILAPKIDKQEVEWGMCLLMEVMPEDGEGEILLRLKTGVNFPVNKLISES